MKSIRGWGFNLGMLINTNQRLKPLLEINSDFFSISDVLVFENGKELVKTKNASALLAGVMYPLNDRIYIKTLLGPCVTNSRVCLSIKPSFGYIMDRLQRFSIQLSLTNVLNYDSARYESLGYLNLAFIARVI